MKTTRTIEEHLVLGDDDTDPEDRIIVEATYIENAPTTKVSFSLGGDATKWFTFDSETIERVAAAVRAVRDLRGDRSEVCADHGMFVPKSPHYRCQKCETAQLAKDAQLRLANLPGVCDP